MLHRLLWLSARADNEFMNSVPLSGANDTQFTITSADGFNWTFIKSQVYSFQSAFTRDALLKALFLVCYQH